MEAIRHSVEPSVTTPPVRESQRPLPSWLTQMFASIDAFDVDRLLTFLSPDCEFRFANAPSLYSHAAIREMCGNLFAALKGISHQELEAWVHPDATICSGRVTYVRHDDTTLTVWKTRTPAYDMASPCWQQWSWLSSKSLSRWRGVTC